MPDAAAPISPGAILFGIALLFALFAISVLIGGILKRRDKRKSERDPES